MYMKVKLSLERSAKLSTVNEHISVFEEVNSGYEESGMMTLV